MKKEKAKKIIEEWFISQVQIYGGDFKLPEKDVIVYSKFKNGRLEEYTLFYLLREII